jgi:RNA polymerase sigma-70 factor (ECF subfamily)
MATLAYTHDEARVQEETDEALLARYASGDGSALGILAERHFPRAYRIAFRVLGDAHAAEDCAQEALARIARAAPTYSPTGTFGGFLYRVVVNAARNQRKVSRRRAFHEARAARRESEGDIPLGPERTLVAEEVGAAVEDLPEELRIPIILHYYEGLTHDEVAHALSLRPGTASSRLRRGLERLSAGLASAGFAALPLGAFLTESGRRAKLPPTPPTPAVARIESAVRLLGRAGKSPVAIAAFASAGIPLALLALVAVALAVTFYPSLAPPPPPPVAVAPPAPAVPPPPAAPPVATVADPEPPKAAKETPGTVKPAGARLTGLVLGPSGKPFAGAAVTATGRENVARVTTSDETGHFALADIAVEAADSLITVEARDPARVLLGAMTFAQAGGKATLELTRGSVVSGRVVVKGTGTGLPGVRLEAEAVGVKLPRITILEADLALSGADGSFTLGPIRDGEYRIVARASGKANARSKRFTVGVGATATVTVEMGEGAALTGRILDPEGHGLENAVVGMYTGSPRHALVEPEEWVEGDCAGRALEKAVGRRLEPGKGDRTLLGEDVVFATTDREGRYRLAHLPRGKRQLVAVHPAWATGHGFVALEDGDATLDLTLEAGGRLEGIARTASGTLAVGGIVAARGMGGGGRFGLVDAVGGYRLDGLDSGDYVVLVAGMENGVLKLDDLIPRDLSLKTVHVSAPRTVRFDAGPSPEGARVVGRVWKTGGTVSLGGVTLARVDDGTKLLAHVSGDDGRFRIEGVAPGRYLLQVHEALGGSSREVRVEVPAGAGEIVQDMDLVSGTIEGQVTGRGEGVTGLVVATSETGESHLGVVWPGRGFSVDGLAAGTYRLRAAIGGVTGKLSAPVSVGPGAVTKDIALVVEGGAPLEVVVEDAEGDPCVAPRALLVPVGEPPLLVAGALREAFGKDPGLVALEAVADGTYDVYAFAEGRPVGVTRSWAVSQDPASRRVSVRLGGAAKVLIVVKTAAGEPASGLTPRLEDPSGRAVLASPLGAHDGAIAPSGPDGTVSVTLLPAGPCTVSVTGPSGVAKANVDLVAGRETTVTLTLP